MNRGAIDFDVAVIGAGSAGLAAAVTAARLGARTVVLERYGFLGGMGTASLVHTFCGLYRLEAGTEPVFANPGFATEMAERMMAATGLPPIRMGRVDVLPQHPVEFVRIADEMVRAEKNLRTSLHVEVTGVSSNDAGWTIKTAERGGSREIKAAVLVDASGDAVVAGLLGADSKMTEKPRLQRPAYVFGVHGVAGFGDDSKLALAGMIVDGVRKAVIPKAALGMNFRASGRAGELFGTLDLAGGGASAEFDPLDEACLTDLEIRGRKAAAEVVGFLAKELDGWKSAYVSHWPVRAGVRESRRWIGEYVLTGDDLLTGRRFDDEIALATWPMEFRETTKGPKLRFPQRNQPAGIPLRCLIPKGLKRIFVAGRCISTDHEAQASIRVMGTCFSTGEAAGRSAYECKSL